MKKIQSKNLFAITAVSILLQSCANHLPELPTDSISPSVEQLEEPINTDASVTPSRTDEQNNQTLTFVAQDLVAGLSSISGASPNQISIKAPSGNLEFDSLVQAAMLRNGYSMMQRFGRSSIKQLVTSHFQKDRPDGSFELTAIISVGSILVRRSYIIRSENIEPATSYFIRGVDPQLVQTRAPAST